MQGGLRKGRDRPRSELCCCFTLLCRLLYIVSMQSAMSSLLLTMAGTSSAYLPRHPFVQHMRLVARLS